jgi:hypothetical protein
MTPFAELVDPFDVTAREWVIELDPQGIHTIARRRLSIRSLPSGTYQAAGRLPGIPPGTTRVLDLEQLSQLLESEPLETLRRPSLIRGSLLSDLLGEFVEAHRVDGIPLAAALRLLEGVTQTQSLKPKSEKKLAKKARKVTFLEALVTLGPGIRNSRRRWKEQLLHSWERNCQLLQDDEVIKQALQKVKPQGQQMRFALRALVDREGRLSLGTWSCELSKVEWDRLWRNPRWRTNTPSEWAEELLAAKARSHTRAIKEQLARERKERNIEASWAAYGRWLSDHPQALRDIEFLLGGLPIRSSTPGVMS